MYKAGTWGSTWVGGRYQESEGRYKGYNAGTIDGRWLQVSNKEYKVGAMGTRQVQGVQGRYGTCTRGRGGYKASAMGMSQQLWQ